MQSRLQSAKEALIGTSTGFVGNAAIVYAVLTWIPADPATHTVIITSACTVFSLLRGYYLRRWFNARAIDRQTGLQQKVHGRA